jgi:hypothetical protein
LVRVVLLAVLVAVAAGWAVLRHYATVPRRLYVPAPATAPTYDEDAGELPVPDIAD